MEKYDTIIGVDPGASGAIAVYINGKSVAHKTPVIKIGEGEDAEIDIVASIHAHLELLSMYNNGNPFCVIEKVGGRHGDAAFKAFNFGKTFGIMLACLTACHIPFEQVHPKTWQKYYGMKRDKGDSDTKWKNTLKAKAQDLYPAHTVTLWSADALLLMNYANKIYNK